MPRRGQAITGPPIPDAPPPQRSKLPWVEIVRPTWEKPVAATIVSRHWRCFYTHWIKAEKQTLPCTGAGCEHCKVIGKHWYAFAVALTRRPATVHR